MAHFEGHDLFHTGQFGFRSGKSTTLALIHLINKIIEGEESHELVGTLFCDLSKAFDCVPPGLLLNKLRYYNFQAKSLQLIQSYFENRKQYVTCNGDESSLGAVLCGVPQGSVLGPVLFLIYVNDFSVGPGTDRVLFADDTTILLRGKNEADVRERLGRAQSDAARWFGANGLSLNQQKTKELLFSSRPSSEIKEAGGAKFLGFYLDPALSWEQHCNELAGKLSRNIFVIRTLKHQVPRETLLLAYHALFLSHCAYGLVVWGHSPNAEKIFGLQRKVVRIIYGEGYREDVRDTYIEHKLLTLPCLYILECLKYVKLHLTDFDMQGGKHEHNTRKGTDLKIDFFRLSHSRFGPNYYGLKFYNLLPIEIQNLPYGPFISYLKKFLLQKALYNFKDFMSLEGDFPSC